MRSCCATSRCTGLASGPTCSSAGCARHCSPDDTFEIYGTGEQSRSFTYVDDAVAATIAAMERAPAGAIYNVGGGDEASMLEAIALLEQISGRELDVRHVDVAQGDVSRTKADITRIRAALGWEPRTRTRRRVGGNVVVGLG